MKSNPLILKPWKSRHNIKRALRTIQMEAEAIEQLKEHLDEI